jgi:hypothetical protein
MSWHCEICDKTLKKTSKSKHLLSKGHIQRSQPILQADQWHCEICDKTLKKTSKNRHVLSKRHIQQLQPVAPVRVSTRIRHTECTLCYEPKPSTQFKKCNRCVYNWCNDCHQKIDRCPYCRAGLSVQTPRRRRRRNNQHNQNNPNNQHNQNNQNNQHNQNNQNNQNNNFFEHSFNGEDVLVLSREMAEMLGLVIWVD